MSVTSQYFFLSSFFSGLFSGINITKPADQPFSENLLPGIMFVNRPNAEVAIDLGPLIATNANIGLVATQLINAGASLTSGIRVQGASAVAKAGPS
jgi:hypothetical protein